MSRTVLPSFFRVLVMRPLGVPAFSAADTPAAAPTVMSPGVGGEHDLAAGGLGDLDVAACGADVGGARTRRTPVGVGDDGLLGGLDVAVSRR
jgi:hypothetical protein